MGFRLGAGRATPHAGLEIREGKGMGVYVKVSASCRAGFDLGPPEPETLRSIHLGLSRAPVQNVAANAGRRPYSRHLREMTAPNARFQALSRPQT